MVVIHARLEPEYGAVVKQALVAARERVYRRLPKDVPAGTSTRGAMESLAVGFEDAPTVEQQHADALVLLAENALHHGIDPGTPAERYQVIVHVDAEVLENPDAPGQSLIEDGVNVAPELSQRVACDASRVVMRHDADGRITEVGARTRTIPPALRRALQHRDRTCRFPRARCGSLKDITFAIGRTVARRRCPISPCCVGGIIGRFTKKAIG
jgi:hypothetical protein